jgi:mannan endo-1,4-beta-mannosidase
MTASPPEPGGPGRVPPIAGLFQRSRAFRVVASAAAVIGVAAVTAGLVQVAVPGGHGSGAAAPHHVVVVLPARPDSYLGAYAFGVPRSYAPLKSLAAATGTRPNIALYYSGWQEPFQMSFARQAARSGAIPLVQIEPGGASLAQIGDGDYDQYLDSYASAVAGYGAKTGRGVIISFGHEPNGSWYPWGYRHVSPATWVRAWQHIVTVFRADGADNVTWLWTVNIIDRRGGIPSPARWWPGSAYVTWVGIDGYYVKPSWEFAPLFGPTIKAIRALTLDPILISETAASPAAGKAAKIANLFAGVRAYGLLGFVWFNADKNRDWRLEGPAVTAYHRGAQTFGRTGP